MAKVKENLIPEPDFKCPAFPEPEQGDYDWQDDQREASDLVAFVVLSLLIGTVSIWAGIASGSI